MNNREIKSLKSLEEGKDSIEIALLEFYKGFNTGNLELLRNNWSLSENVIMSNPLGGILKGWDQIELLYSRIFDGPLKVHVDFYDVHISQWNDGFLAVGRERGEVSLNGESVVLEIRTSRFFILSEKDNRFYQLHHHGSIESPALLASYQNLVKQANQQVAV